MSESRKPSNWGRRRHGPDPSRWRRPRLLGPLAVLLPVIALIAAILPSSAMAAGLSGTSVSGHLYSSTSSQALSGITVTAIDATTSANGGQTTTTASDGSYTLTGLTSGDYYYLEFSSPDLSPTEYYDEGSSDAVTSSATTAASDAGSDSALDSGTADSAYVSISGLNGTSIYGSLYDYDTGTEISGATVTAFDVTTPANGGQTATTDSSGDYTLNGLTQGDVYYLSFAASGYVTQYYDENSYPYDLTASSAQAAADALAGDDSDLQAHGESYDAEDLVSGGAVSGTVSFPTGTSPDGEVDVYVPNGGDFWTYIDSNGDYSVLGVATGSRYVVGFEPYVGNDDYVYYGGSSGTSTFSQNDAAQLSVTSGQAIGGVDFSDAPTATVTGAVSGPSGALNHAEIYLYDLSGNEVQSTYTNSSGQFTLDSYLDPGTYYLEARDNNSNDGLAPAFSGVFSVAAGGTATENITMSAGGTVTGTVSGPTGTELTDSYVYITAVNGTWSTYAGVNSSGTYTFQALPAGSYYVEWYAAYSSYPDVWYDGSSLASIEQNAEAVTVSNGQSTTANFSNIPQAGEIRGTVTDAAMNQPVEGVYVEVLDSQGNYVTEAETDIDGSYDVTGLLPGSYKLEFVPEAYAHVAGDPQPDLAYQYYADASSFAAASTVTVGAGQTVNGIDAALVAGGTVSGRVTDAATGAGVPDMTVELLTASGEDVDSGYTNADGTYTIYGVAPGSYYVEFDATYVGAGETVAQFYGDKPTLAGATTVAVSAGQAVQNIDAAVSLLTVPPTTVPPTTVPPITVPAAVTPVVHLLSHSGLVKGNRLGVRLRCSAGACRGSVKVTTSEVVYIKHGKKRVRKHHTVTIGTARYTASTGQTKTLTVKLNRAGTRALAKAKNHHLSVTITATVSGGKKATRHEKIWTATKKK